MLKGSLRLAALTVALLFLHARPAACAAADSTAALPGAAFVDSIAPAPALSASARLLLSWHAPYGQPRATAALRAPCGRSAAEDTLYVCCDPGADSPTFNGFTVRLLMHPGPRDSLAAFWREARADGQLTHVRVVLDPDSSLGVPTPFRVSGMGVGRTDLAGGAVRVRMIYAVANTMATPVRAGTVYLLARVIVQRPRAKDAACGRGLCVEVDDGTLAFKLGDEPHVKRGDRFVSVNATVEGACAKWRAISEGWHMPEKH